MFGGDHRTHSSFSISSPIRISTGKGLAVLLLPPYTFYFSFYELQEEGKERPIALWMWGLVTTILVAVAFMHPIQLVLQGRAAELNPPTEEELTKAYGAKEFELEALADLPIPPPEPQNVAGTNNAGQTGAQTNGGTNQGTETPPADAPPTDAPPTDAPAEAPPAE